MITRSFILIVMFIILFALASGLIFLIKDGGKSNRTVKALTWRIAISVGLFLFLLLGFALGFIQPHPI